MKTLLRFTALCSLVILCGLILGSKAHADTLGAVQDYQIPSGANPYSIIESTDGDIWFTQQHSSNKVWKFDRDNYDPNNHNAAFTSYTLSAMPVHIVAGPNGSVWITLNGKVAKITNGGTVTEYTLPSAWISGQWHTYAAQAITLGPDGNIWVFAQSNTTTDAVFRMNYDASIASKYTGFPDNEIIESVADYANQRVWIITRAYSYPAGYTSKATYFNMDGTNNTYTLGISSAMTGAATSDGKLWFGGDGKKLQNINSSGTLSSVYNLPYTATLGIWRVRAGTDGYLWATLSYADKLVRIDENGNMSTTYLSNLVPGGNGAAAARPIGLTAGSDGNMWFTQYANNRISKIGTGGNGTTIDTDGDGLNRSQEIQIGTSDYIADSDGDGLSDNIESPWFANRDDVFCGTSCAYPDPIRKDLYIEADWMVKTGVGGYSTKPSSTHLLPIVTAFSNKGIILHVDTGDFGGGNEVPYNSDVLFGTSNGVVDFYDYKLGGDSISAQFDSANRFKVWRYMLFADYIASPYNDALGIALTGDDDSMMANGKLRDTYSGGTLDTKISQAIIHELGHNICLSIERRYDAQDDRCIYEYIDNPSAPSTYLSSMNYNLSVLDYSTGSNGTNDHNDWAAITGGINDFLLDSNNGGQNDNMEITVAKKVKQKNGKDKIELSHKTVKMEKKPPHEK